MPRRPSAAQWWHWAEGCCWQLECVLRVEDGIYLLFQVHRLHDPRLPASSRPRPTEVWVQLVRSRSERCGLQRVRREEPARRRRSRSRSPAPTRAPPPPPPPPPPPQTLAASQGKGKGDASGKGKGGEPPPPQTLAASQGKGKGDASGKGKGGEVRNHTHATFDFGEMSWDTP